jgi:hypothetical protein
MLTLYFFKSKKNLENLKTCTVVLAVKLAELISTDCFVPARTAIPMASNGDI